MMNRTTPAFFASCVLHLLLLFMVVSFLRAPRMIERKELPLARIMTLVNPPQVPAAPAVVSPPKPRLEQPAPPPEPVNLTPVAEPVASEPLVPEQSASVSEIVSASTITAPTGVSVTSPRAPIDPVYPASRLKDGLVPLVRTETPYPLIAQDRGIQGSVDVLFVVDKSGNVEEAWIAKSSHKIFSDAVMKNEFKLE
jgi:outer membrane biosynthesis protein TonB